MKMNIIHFTYKPTLHSHTHWQAPQADTQAQACQRVCLSHAERKKLKIPFPSKIFKNANPQTDTKTFGQLVAKLNKEKGFRHGRQERQPVTAVLRNGRCSGKLKCSFSNQHLWWVDSEVLRNPPLRKAENR